MGGWWPCSECCEWPCAVFSDTFDDAASTTLSDEWSELLGNWEYTGTGLLRENGVSGACVLTAATTKTVEQYIAVALDDFATGDVVRMICNAVDVNNYYFVQVTEQSSNTKVEFCRRLLGSDAVLATFLVPNIGGVTGVSMTLCFDSESMTWSSTSEADAANIFAYICRPTLFAHGKKAGLGNGSTTVLDFDSFSLQNFWGRNNDGWYHCCNQQCEATVNGVDYCIPSTLTLTLTAGDDCETDLDGETMSLTYNTVEDAWLSEAGVDHPGCALNSRWVLRCTNDPNCTPDPLPEGKQFDLELYDYDPQACYAGGDCLGGPGPEASVSINPLVITFPKVEYSDPGPPAPPPDCQCCDDGSGSAGWWRATITE